MNNVQEILIIGGGLAGTVAAISAKRQNPTASVTLLAAELCEPYEKPPLSKAVLLSDVLPRQAPIAGPDGVAGHGVVLRMGARSTAIDRNDRCVIVESGQRLPYDRLVIATGAIPREVAQLPFGMPGVHYLRTETDAKALKKALLQSRDLVIAGGGLIGLEVAACSATLGVKTTVLEIAPRILARVADEETAKLVHDAHVQHGVKIRVRTGVVAATPQMDGRMALETSNGESVITDLVVVGVGSKPDDQLARAAGLRTDDGVIVDQQCRTSDPLIFAAGDVARFPGPNGLVRLENWRHAQDQGGVAGRNAAGANETYATVPSFWSEQYDLYIQGVGWPDAGIMVRRPLQGNGSLTFQVRGDRLVRAIGINAQRDFGAARRLVERCVPIDSAALADPAQPLARMLTRTQEEIREDRARVVC